MPAAANGGAAATWLVRTATRGANPAVAQQKSTTAARPWAGEK
jgi:hypothetical protein